MTLLGGVARDVAEGFLAAQADPEHLAGRHPVERQARANEGHRAGIPRDVQFVVDGLSLVMILG